VIVKGARLTRNGFFRDIALTMRKKSRRIFFEVTMISKTMIVPERKRILTPPFAWIDRRFLFEGFLAALSPRENLLYFFLVLVADRNGVSFYSYDKICTLLKLDVDAYVQARDGLIRKQLIAFDGQLFQVLALPKTGPAMPVETSRRASDRQGNMQALREIITRLAQQPAELSSPIRLPAPEAHENQNRFS
jgi:hypothetical protein